MPRLIAVLTILSATPPYPPDAAEPALVRLTFAAEAHISPVYSPNGRYIACIERGLQAERCLMLSRDGQRIAMGGTSGSRVAGPPSWSPDSRSVCWLTADGSLWILDADGSSRETHLPAVGAPRQAIWQRRDARALVATHLGIYSFPIDSAKPPQRLSTAGEPGEMGPISLSRDGSGLAYIAADRVYVTPGPTSAGTEIAGPASPGTGYTGVWLAPDGNAALVLEEARGLRRAVAECDQPPVPLVRPSALKCRMEAPARRLLWVDRATLAQTEVPVGEGELLGVVWAPEPDQSGRYGFLLALGCSLVRYCPGEARATVVFRSASEVREPTGDPHGRNVVFSSPRDATDPSRPRDRVPNLYAVAL